mmetsp:Transcript_27101/g.83506  ORF Transcript_27101/g.83506 Transcript_27101/m.83506 type:complete len:459 (+) Transcript_27101:368-1744(+)
MAAMEEMEMDDLFDRHLEEHEGAFEEDDFGSPTPTPPSAAAAAAAAQNHSQFDEVEDDDASMGDLENYQQAEYVPGSSLQPNNPLLPVAAPAPAADPFGFGASGAGATVPWGPAPTPDGPGKGLKRVASQELPVAGRPQSGDAPCAADFKIIRVIGKGSFGKVFLVRQVSTGVIYAMKVLKKENIVKRNQVEHTKTERSVLGYLRHPFLVSLNMAFQTRDKLFFVLDYCAGGELFCHLQRLGKFAEPRARFYTAELVLALAHVHALGVVYRDLKPENLVLDSKGYVKLVDLGLAKVVPGKTWTLCGTPDYLAPEVILNEGHDKAVDYWALGVLMYELVAGSPPFYADDPMEVYEKILSGNMSFPSHFGKYLNDVVRKLLKLCQSKRLGNGKHGCGAIKKHRFFSGFGWDDLLEKREDKLKPPIEIKVANEGDASNFDQYDETTEEKVPRKSWTPQLDD